MSTNFNRETPTYRSPAAETPYLRAKQQWDQRSAAFALGADLWRRCAVVAISLAVLLLIALLISLSWHKPKLYIAEVGQDGQVMNVKLLAERYQPNQAQEEYFIVQFIKLIRNVPLDPVAAHNNWASAYHFLTNRGADVLNDFFKKNSPLAILSKKTVTVTINDINPLTSNSFQVDWTEQSVGQNGQLLGQQLMSGIFTIIIKTPTTKEEMLANPLGVYIVDFHMSPRLS